MLLVVKLQTCRNSRPELIYDALRTSQNSQGNTFARVSFLIKLKAEATSFTKKETLAQLLSCEFYEIFNNTFFIEHLHTTACEA